MSLQPHFLMTKSARHFAKHPVWVYPCVSLHVPYGAGNSFSWRHISYPKNDLSKKIHLQATGIFVRKSSKYLQRECYRPHIYAISHTMHYDGENARFLPKSLYALISIQESSLDGCFPTVTMSVCVSLRLLLYPWNKWFMNTIDNDNVTQFFHFGTLTITIVLNLHHTD